MSLEADDVIQRSVSIIAPQLHNGVIFVPRARIAQADRLHRAVAQSILSAASHDLDRHAAFKNAAVVKAVDGRLLRRAKLADKCFVLGFVHRAVYIICRALIVARCEKRAFHLNTLKRYDRRDGIVKMQSLAAAQGSDLICKRVAR